MTSEALPGSSIRNSIGLEEKAKVDRYLLMPLPVHYEKPIDQSKALKLIFSAWAIGMDYKPIVMVANREGEKRDLVSTGEEINSKIQRLPEDVHIAAFAPSAAGPLILSTMTESSKLTDFDKEYAVDQILDRTRIDRAVIACSRVRIGEGGKKYIDGYRESHMLYAESITQMDEYARRLDERVRLGLLAEQTSDRILGYVARGDVHVPDGTGIDSIPQVPFVESKFKGHGKGIFLGSMFDHRVREHLSGAMRR